jgi:ribosomal protein S18 acetylase RimI-like enzyme
MNREIRKASVEDAAIVALLFDSYRSFYKQAPDVDAAFNFIKERLQQNESVIFIAFIKDNAVGFVQLYPIFTSVGMKRAWLLNDLYIHVSSRGKGVATALLDAAKEFAKSTGSKWLMLQTASDNYTAQTLYKKNGWKKETDVAFIFVGSNT